MLETEVRKLVADGRRIEARKLVERKLGVKKRAAQERVRKILGAAPNDRTKEVYGVDALELNGTSLEFQDRYVYNKETGQYIFLCKKLGKNIVLEEGIVKSLLAAYSNFNGSGDSLNKISREFDIPRPIVQEILHILKFTHDEIPVTREEYLAKEKDEIVEELIQKKKFQSYQEFQRRDWRETAEDADKWRQFQMGWLNPFKDFVATFEFEKHKTKIPAIETAASQHLVIGLSDLHFGADAQKEEIFGGKEWNIEKTREAVSLYLAKIKKFAAASKIKWRACHVISLGDIIHSLTGFTDKGTPIETHPLGAKQFKIAFQTLDLFFEGLLSIFDEVKVKAVSGNHDSLADLAVFECLAAAYRKDERITFEVCETRWLTFKIEKTLFLIEHGYSAFYKSKVPKADNSRGNYVQSLLLKNPELLIGVNQKIFLVGDMHSFENKEYNEFEYIRFSTLVGADKYANHSNLSSRPRQNALVVDEEGVKEIVNFYL